MATPVQTVTRQVRPLLSLNQSEARRRVFNLYRAWVRQIPFILQDYEIPKSDKDLKEKIRGEFMKHANIKDIRVIDMLVIKGQMELKEVAERWKNKGTLMFYFKDTVEPKPTDFLSKFMSGHDP
ncbi:NADH dehydrogenase [ubiquinone] 1 alpha subcomplex subunit 6 isoform X1 [Nasonia vitripennis]|uniref:NADH dehydrogenase [ubiquinone] 1 alpha subcomplex subunit 6 n=2 Tax=Nasonia vitripennis TaxID=7425 RepID=A0A7M6URV2_NASVI|nr:NADH dehydrogenase [ubiquinone] 1 alpha subcomplex subunit 6 [Nasonia vitripennis]XP_008207906.1 NADH dehydrogenase [ubiquinone] 1 alpha subcomplex subunit 6 isoform X1 [Nasonia vitripennis]XP_032452164.1 NADH dehydrogenase [ubiquinone] 1 alpha subcomplex subunit 6 isoform X1 [Nasonia vitripennis]XP_032452165.1 NADH dehydrogenase [ubiquinone] 1 alpha subcomplex subunit 6 isoform X1 [Nasonia vitripennis]XP_032452166.1 NADH dehydrogenase [ubiquinone] 1 alpha subcomplex subunit 6 isoform X1 [Na